MKIIWKNRFTIKSKTKSADLMRFGSVCTPVETWKKQHFLYLYLHFWLQYLTARTLCTHLTALEAQVPCSSCSGQSSYKKEIKASEKCFLTLPFTFNPQSNATPLRAGETKLTCSSTLFVSWSYYLHIYTTSGVEWRMWALKILKVISLWKNAVAQRRLCKRHYVSRDPGFRCWSNQNSFI